AVPWQHVAWARSVERRGDVAREDITRLLQELGGGEAGAQEALLAAVYGELHAIAHRRLQSGGRDAVLDTTALIHESYVRLFDRDALPWVDRRHFFSVAAMAMRQIIVDHARKPASAKRGGGAMDQGREGLPRAWELERIEMRA